jgi:hypothetical protein
MPHTINTDVTGRGRICALALVSAALALSAAAGAQEPATRGVIRWRSGALVTQRQDARTLAETPASAVRSGARHVVLQFDRPVTPAERVRLEAAGVRLLSYVGDNAFFASLAGERPVALGQIAGLRCALPVERNWKLHAAIVAGEWPAWAVVAGSKASVDRLEAGSTRSSTKSTTNKDMIVAAYVLFHGDVALDEAVGVCQQHGAHIRSRLRAINGLVIELPAERVAALADEDGVQWIEPPLPRLSPVNNDVRARVGADIVQAPPYGLDGAGVTVLVYDGGAALASHPDFGGRLHVGDLSATSYHATHVAGTIGGSGAASGGVYRGMAPGVRLESYGFEQLGGIRPGFLYTDPGDLESDYAAAVAAGADIANNSIGSNVEANGYDCAWQGDYGAVSQLIDAIVRGSLGTPFRVVWAGGNERQGARCNVEGYGEYYSVAPPAGAKNHITVGAVNSDDDTMTSFSSWGPTDDGRLKPDVVAPGCQITDDRGVTSCGADWLYMTLCGTSMACPAVTGLGALLLQDFRQHHPGAPDFRNSTLKILLAHTAVDRVAEDDNPGPDYRYGYGSVRVQPAVELLRSGNFLEGVVDQHGVHSAVVVVQPGQTQLKATLAWDDAPAAPNADPVLVNDLDLRVFDATNHQYFPWTLDPLNPGAPAVRTQADQVNNIEQVVIDNPAPGAYRVEVYGFNVPQGPQPFSMCATPRLSNCGSAGTIALDRPKYACQGAATIRVVDCGLNADDGVIETVTVAIASTSEPAGEAVLLTETGPATAAFVGTIPLAQTVAAGVLRVAPGATVTATYIDADDGAGGANVTVVATAVVDCQPPVISNVAVTDLRPHSATVSFDTDEPAQALVRYGLACGMLGQSKPGLGVATHHSVRLSGLQADSAYFLTIDVADEAGNAATDDNAGGCYAFTTPRMPNFFTEEFAGDFDLDGRAVLLTPDGSADAYTACVYPIAGLPTDPAGGTPLTPTDDDYTAVTLSAGKTVALYGVSYGTFYASPNGYITFTAGDTDASPSLDDHFRLPRVAVLFHDFDARYGGFSWRELGDRAVVTWQNVPEWNTSNSNTFQVEMFYDGRMRLSWLGVAAVGGISGLSAGTGLSLDFVETDLSAAGSCGPRRPWAGNLHPRTPQATPVTLELVGSDDGLPDPPGALRYVIQGLPTYELRDAGNGYVIQAGDLPYTVVGGDRRVTYRPFSRFRGVDTFQYFVDDGGSPPTGGASDLALVTVTVGAPEAVIRFPLDSDPGWSREGLWQFGVPLGGGSEAGDPTSGHTGMNVFGYNLAGDYENNLAVRWLTTGALDCTGLTGVELHFWRWLGVEDAAFDHASVQVSTSGASWTTIWEHTGPTLCEAAWSEQVYDVAQLADGQPTVYVRWGMGPTDYSLTYAGWNLDDVEIWAEVPAVLGDMNCNGVVNFDDINAFVTALVGQAAYAAHEPDCNYYYADLNGDGAVNFDDISPFVTVLTHP